MTLNHELAARFIEAKYNLISRQEIVSLFDDVKEELAKIKNEKEDVYRRYPRVHGRFQQSQLDVLDIHEQKISAIFDNLNNMLLTVN
jgi:arsenate reductase-like glutaredoxin family protein